MVTSNENSPSRNARIKPQTGFTPPHHGRAHNRKSTNDVVITANVVDPMPLSSTSPSISASSRRTRSSSKRQGGNVASDGASDMNISSVSPWYFMMCLYCCCETRFFILLLERLDKSIQTRVKVTLYFLIQFAVRLPFTTTNPTSVNHQLPYVWNKKVVSFIGVELFGYQLSCFVCFVILSDLHCDPIQRGKVMFVNRVLTVLFLYVLPRTSCTLHFI